MVFSWVRRGLRTGVVTTRYPTVQEQMPEGFRGRPIIDANRCMADQGCNACVQVCLPGALNTLDSVNKEEGMTYEEVQQLTLDYTRCIMCGLCVTACPEDALRMTADYELAARKREDLLDVSLFLPTPDEERENGKEY